MDSRIVATAMAAGTLAVVSSSSYTHPITAKDVVRAHTDVPLPGSHVLGAHPAAAFAGMNNFLESREGLTTSPCHDFELEELHDVAEIILTHKDDKLNKIYEKKNDNRFVTSLEEHKTVWAQELEKANQYGIDTEDYKMIREGKCAEIVMWWIHHLAEGTQQKLQGGDFRLPLMPVDHNENGDEAYAKRLSCTECHLNVGVELEKSTYHSPSKHLAVGGDRLDKGECAIDEETGLPSVWYESEFDVGNRIKRCDMDYETPCQPCEGRGGQTWGDQQDEFMAVPCRVVGGPRDIPENERVLPVWPRGFTAEVRYTLINSIDSGGLFPGGDPCDQHAIRNQTITMYYDGTRDPRGPVVRRDSRGFLDNQVNWTLNDFNFYIKIEDIFCICITVRDADTNVPIGPLRYDWADNSVYVGREEIELEFQGGRVVVADHWNKGPHHHWMDIRTGEFVRGWQPWQALNTFFDWNNEFPPLELFQVDRSCYEGDLNQNISCVSGPPTTESWMEEISEF